MPMQLTDQQQALHALLAKQDRKLADMYLGSLMVLNQEENPNRIALAANGLRGMIDFLPQHFDVPTGDRTNLVVKVREIKDKWASVKNSTLQGESAAPSVVDDRLRSFLSDLDQFIAWYEDFNPTRDREAAAFLRAIDPLHTGLPKPIEQVWVKLWRGYYRYFASVLHHGSTTVEEFERHLTNFEGFLLGYLRPRTLEDHARLDAIIQRVEVAREPLDDQTIQSVQTACRLTANYLYFFDHLTQPLWIVPLSQRGFFQAPPSPIRENGLISFPLWAESQYLVRMAATASRDIASEITKVVLAMPVGIDNFRVYSDLVAIALSLPVELAVRMVDKIREVLSSRYLRFLPPASIGRLALYLARGGNIATGGDLMAALFEALGSPEVQIESWYFENALTEFVPDIVSAGGLVALDKLCGTLSKLLSCTSDNDATGSERKYRPDDDAVIGLAAIEPNDQNFLTRPSEMLTLAIRDAAESLIGKGIATVGDVIQIFETHTERVYQRLTLHLLRRFPSQALELIDARLTSRVLFDDLRLRHEYALLLRDRYSYLSTQSQRTILSWIEDGPATKNNDAASSEYRRVWQRDWLSFISDHLPGDWQQRYTELVSDLGPANHPEYLTFVSKVTGLISPLTPNEIREMSIAELVTFLKEWVPSTGIWASSREGLSQILVPFVSANPERFALEAEAFIDVPLTFVADLLTGLRDAVRQRQGIPWESVLKLCRTVVSYERTIEEDREYRANAYNNQVVAHTTIADLLQLGLAEGPTELPAALHGDVWLILARLMDDPHPTQEYEDQYSKSGGEYWELSQGPVRCRALETTIRYAQWRQRNIRDGISAEGTGGASLNEVPEVKNVLRQHLDPAYDPSLAVRSLYGELIPLLIALDSQWMAENVREIFPQGSATLRTAAWDGYVVTCTPDSVLYDLLLAEYAWAIERLDSAVSRSCLDENKVRFSPEGHLARHLMILYWHDLVALDDGIGLVAQFFEKAPCEVRQYALFLLGFWLHGLEMALPETRAERLRVLWEWYLDRFCRDGTTGECKELAAFGWWFISGKLDDEWSLAQLKRVFNLAHAVDFDDFVVERLAELARTLPKDSLGCLSLLIDYTAHDADLHRWTNHMRTIVSSCMDESNAQNREDAIDIMHRLASRGMDDLRDLLP